MSIDSQTKYLHFVAAISLGPEASALRAAPVGGRVIACVSQGVYLESDSGLVLCIVGGEIDGPLTVRVPKIAPLLAALRSHPGAAFHATEGAIHIEDIARIGWSHASYWMPQMRRGLGSLDARQSAVDALSESILRAGRTEGCGPLVQRLVAAWRAMPLRANIHDLGPISCRILSAIYRLRDAMLSSDYTGAAKMLAALVGLGHGLTPSGDDLAMGVAAMLVWQSSLGYAPIELARQIASSLCEVAPTRTNRISARLLWHACNGVLYAPAMDLGAALLSGDAAATQESSQLLCSLGNTTGVDLAVGILLGLLMGAGERDRYVATQ